MNQVEKAVSLFEGNVNCSQAMLIVFGEPYGLDSEIAKKLGRPFGGGIGRLAQICGAVTGAIMVLGLACDREDEDSAKDLVYERVREFVHRFEKLHGTSICKGLLGADLSTEEGRQKVKEEKLTRKICPGLVRDAGELLADLLKS